jgi:uncharacterized protein
MIQRTLGNKTKSLAGKFPIIAITGPRQSGKTTLAKMIFRKHDYVNLEDPEERELATNDPRAFLKRFSGGVILDEIQKVPILFSYLQGIADAHDSPGRFVLTGSQQFQLLHKVSQTLAGRTAILNLLPFTVSELCRQKALDPYRFDLPSGMKKKPAFNLETILFQGFYPRIHDKSLDARDWLSSYYKTYVERDVRDIINIGNLSAFQKFLMLCAGRAGQLLNLSSLAMDCGISHTTARQWLSVLQAGFIVFLLHPHYANFSKRIIKSPKLYFIDTGLLCYLLKMREPSDFLFHPLKGAIFENFVVSELYKTFSHMGEIPPLYFWRDRTGHEIDIVIDTGRKLIPVEIKAGETVSESFYSGLKYYMSFEGNISDTGVLVYGGENFYKREKFLLKAWFQCS